jgi:hypothetical protein
VAIKADPNVIILCPVGLKEGICVSLCMDAGFPLVVNFSMTGSAGLGFETGQTFWNLLIGNGVGIVGSQPKDHGWLYFCVIEVDQTTKDDEPD